MADGALRESATLFELRSIIVCYCSLPKVSMAPARQGVGLRRSGLRGREGERRSGSIILRGGSDALTHSQIHTLNYITIYG